MFALTYRAKKQHSLKEKCKRYFLLLYCLALMHVRRHKHKYLFWVYVLLYVFLSTRSRRRVTPLFSCVNLAVARSQTRDKHQLQLQLSGQVSECGKSQTDLWLCSIVSKPQGKDKHPFVFDEIVGLFFQVQTKHQL